MTSQGKRRGQTVITIQQPALLLGSTIAAAWALNSLASPALIKAAGRVPGGHTATAITFSRPSGAAVLAAGIGARVLHHTPASLVLGGIGIGIFLGEGN